MQIPDIFFTLYVLPAAIFAYFALFFSRALQNIFLLLLSLTLYAWGEPAHVLLLLFSIAVNWVFGLAVGPGTQTRRFGPVIAAVCFNLGLLFCARYTVMLGSTVTYFFGDALPPIPAPASVPLGVAIFTLLGISYIVDVYRGDAEAATNPFSLGLYLSFFPLQFAGPVVQYADIAEQLRNRKTTLALFSSGCSKFVVGLAKLVLIARPMGDVADSVFTLSSMGVAVNVPAMLALVGAAAYMAHIYFFLSGYADAAIGLGRMFGFTFKENFDYPYTATSMTDFWKRWNITAVDWFFRYVFQPLRRKRARRRGAHVESTEALYGHDMLLVWGLFGLWCGPGWTFFLWGLLHGFFMVFESVTSFREQKLPVFFKRVYVLAVLLLTWTMYRADNLYNALSYLKNMLGLNNNGFYSDFAVVLLMENAVYFAAAFLFCLPLFRMADAWCERNEVCWPRAAGTVCAPFALLLLYGLSFLFLLQQ